ncbi:TlpA family protein disulfide reductase [Pinibacter soli]|uniref:TlpA disulfide reductase family protein n=1 Tax=Pinibacter soli TaxID=3044211 RepID=A0ABT6RB50_9BACT|nr:TlpA disulfide reductase family protein [Pinibacter soli]MDI3319797.1 TlpA disulfide reductase family protein [Pinibacter soli]
MKKITIVICFVIGLMSGALAQKNTTAIIQGENARDIKTPLELFAVKEGAKEKIAVSYLNKDGNFAFAIPNCEEGLYYICDTVYTWYSSRFYLKPGDNVTIKFKDKEAYEVISGSPEMTVLAKWNELAAPVAKAARDTTQYPTFFASYQKLMPQAETFKKQIATKNTKFNAFMKSMVDWDMNVWPIAILVMPKPARPEREQYPAFYDAIIKNTTFSSTSILQFGNAADYMHIFSVVKYAYYEKKYANTKPTTSSILKDEINITDNDTLKGIVLAHSLALFRTYNDFTAATDQYKKYLLTPVAKAKYFDQLKKVSTFSKGSYAYNFEYENSLGKKVSLSDLKGKIVVVDIWATWCAPCKAEMPFMKKLEDEMKAANAPVEFVSISTDGANQKQVWLDYVQKNALGGVQLNTGGKQDLMEFYSIAAIPRFILIDADGKLITASAPRPSNPDLKKMLMAAIGGDDKKDNAAK